MDRAEAETPDGLALISAGYSIDMLAALPKYAASDGPPTIPTEVSSACLESFLMHVRLLVEYFLPPPSGRRHDRNHYVTDFEPSWRYPDNDRRERSKGWHQDASKFVAHITNDRTDIKSIQVRDGSRAALEAVAEDVYAVIEAVCAANEIDHPSKVRFLRTAVELARQQVALSQR